MRFLRYVILTICLSFCTAATAAGLDAVGPSPLLPQSPLVISAYSIFSDGTPRYFEIYNDSSVPQNAASWILETEWAMKPSGILQTPKLQISLADRNDLYIPPGGYIVAGFNGAVANASLGIANVAVSPENYASKISLRHTSYRPYERTFAANITQSPMRLTQGASGYNTTYAIENRIAGEFPWQSSWHQVSQVTDLQIVEIYPNSLTCQPFDTEVTCGDYVKIYNPSAETSDLGQFRLRTGAPTQSASASNSVVLSGGLPAYSYAVVPLNLTNSGGVVWLEDKYGLLQYHSSMIAYPDGGSQKGRSWAYDNSSEQWRWSSYPTPYNEPNRFTDGSPINTCTTLRLSEIGANLPDQFIEIYNASSEPVSMLGCQLQTNRSQDISYVFGDQVLAGGEFTIVRIAQTKLSLTKTTSGTVYLLSSDGLTEVDARSYENMSEKSSFALVDGIWRQTFAVTPGGVNIHEQYLPCEMGYERNVDTGRCNKIAVATTAAVCDIDEYRNPETNRCRKLASGTSTLVSCKEGQYRSPETNRCRSLDAASTELKPCVTGQERNPDTNRCRKSIEGDGTAGFEVVDTPNTSDQMLSWFALGGVGFAALGYAGWEWRREVWDVIRRIAGLLPFVK